MDGVKFNFRKLTAGQFDVLLKASRELDIPAIAEVFAGGVVEACPKGWGQPDDPNTYKNLPYFGEFTALLRAANEAITEAAKN